MNDEKTETEQNIFYLKEPNGVVFKTSDQNERDRLIGLGSTLIPKDEADSVFALKNAIRKVALNLSDESADKGKK